MGFLGTLGKIGAGIAAPFTGGASLAAIPLIDAAGKIASSVSAGRAAGRQSEAEANNQYDLLRLAAARLNLEAPGQRAQNSVRGDVLAHAQPASISGPIVGTHGQVPQISGGLSPALFSQNTKQLGGQMSREALLAQMQGPAFTPQAAPHSSALDGILNGIGTAGLVTGALGQPGVLKPKPQVPTLAGPMSPNVRLPQIPRMPWDGQFNGVAL